jgi:hypothetical protein
MEADMRLYRGKLLRIRYHVAAQRLSTVYERA